ncbi:MAG: low specificity L-threonine aldolase [Steroidobacteraceae bacterium]
MTASDVSRDFASDNVEGASPEILEAMIRANAGPAPSYGADALTSRVTQRLRQVFEHESLEVLLVSSGTAANALSLAAVTPPWGSVLCHDDAHVFSDECGAPAFFGDGLALATLPGPASQLELATLRRVAAADRGDVHSQQPACVTVTQATEGGTVYSLEALQAIGAVCRDHRLRFHMDGARFANALVRLDCTPAQMTWRAGVDLLSFGATKNGALGAEAIVCFDPALAESLAFRRKRAGHLASKMRFIAAQLDAYLEGDLWLRNARHANAMAQRLANGLAALPGISFVDPVDANLLFVRFPAGVAERLWGLGFRFYPDRRNAGAVRLATSFRTSRESVDAFLEAARPIG